jgi:hypothetical protein
MSSRSLPPSSRGSSAGPHTPRRRRVCSQTSFPALAAVNARFYQAEPAPVVGTTKSPESLCLRVVLPPSGRRGPPPPRTLLLGFRSYGLMRQSRWLSPASVVHLVRGVLAGCTSPCCQQHLPDAISANLSSDAWSPTTTVSPSAITCFFLGVIGLPQDTMGRLPVFIRERDFAAG